MNEDARKRALSLLDKRDYSRKMLIDKLTGKGISPEDAAEVADWLTTIGVIDDARYAALVVRHYGMKGYGALRIREELFRRGVDRELWEDSLRELEDTDDTVYPVLEKKLHGSHKPEDMERARSFLLRRGFPRDVVRSAIERYMAENEVME